MVLRSHHGCARCKRRRQKCTEGRPSCRRCLDAAVPCEYSIVLKWNGRVPRDLQSSQPKGPDTADLGFDSDDAPLTHLIHGAVRTTPSEQDDAFSERNIQRPARELSLLDQLASTQKLLLHHFVKHSSMISSHTYLRQQLCEQISLALDIPSLMDATMALAALHRASLLGEPPNGFVPEPMISKLINRSLRNLRCEIEAFGPSVNHLHTIRTLCTCEIYSGKADCAWRVHVNGARTVLASASAAESDRSTWRQAHWLTLTWYESIQSLGALTGSFLRANRVDDMAQAQDWLLQPHRKSYTFDLYAGYSSDLNQVFRFIGRAVMDAKVNYQPDEQSGSRDLQERADFLETTVRRMIFRDATEGLRLPSDIDMTEQEVEQFTVCNAVYQYSALIHIHRKLQHRPARSSEVQACVRSILDAVCTIMPVSTLSPWVLLTTPIFVAGCEAFGQDRPRVETILRELYSVLRVRNVLRALDVLTSHWKSSSDSNAMLFGGDGLDFISY